MVKRGKKAEQERQAKALAEARASVKPKESSDNIPKHAEATRANNRPNNRPNKKLKYSNAQEGMNWWNFRIERMSVGERYLFLGLAIIIPVLACFFAGLAIDWFMQQPATWAIWGIGIGGVAALVIVYKQLKKLV